MKILLLTIMVMVFAGVGMAENLALDGTVTATSQYSTGWAVGMIIDDDPSTGWHSNTTDPSAALTLDLGATAFLTSIEIANRTDCCSDRIVDLVVTVEDANHNVIATSAPITDQSALWVWDNEGAGFNLVRYITIGRQLNGVAINLMELRALGDFINATNIAPADGAVGILIDKDDVSELSPTLEWAANELVDAGSITGYFLYLGTDEAAVSDAVVGDDTMIGNTYMTATTYQHPANLDKDTTYFWCVDTRLQDDPNTISGNVWDFTTELTLPQIVTQPAGQSELVGQDAVITIEAIDPLGGDLTYQWFFDPNTLVEGDETALSGNGADTDTLTVPAAQKSDAGNYYCEVSNPRTVVSEAALLSVGELVAYWPFDGSVTEVITGTECTIVGDPVYGDSIVGDTSLEVNGDDYVEVPPAALAGMSSERFTLSLWVQSTGTQQNAFAFYGTDASAADTYYRVIQSHIPWSNNNIYFDAGGLGGYDRINAGAAPWITNGEWRHLVYTKDIGTGMMKIYIDGGLWIEGSGMTLPLGEITLAVIGANLTEAGGGVQHLFNGKIDDIQIYDIALDEYDIADMYYDVTGEYQCFVRPAGDLDDDCKVTLTDFAILAADWLVCNKIPSTSCD